MRQSRNGKDGKVKYGFSPDLARATVETAALAVPPIRRPSFSPDLARATVETASRAYVVGKYVSFSPDLARATVETEEATRGIREARRLFQSRLSAGNG